MSQLHLMTARTVSIAGFRVPLPAIGTQHEPGPSQPVTQDRLGWLIVGNQEISRRTGASKALIHSWTSRPHRGFPTPIVTLAAGPLYWWPEVNQWLTAQADTATGDGRRHALAQPAGPLEGPARPAYLPMVGVAEIAAHTAVQNSTVCNWRQRYRARDPRFPASVLELAMGPIFWWPDIEQWLVASGKPGTLAGAE
jgi:hypothetical protein